MGRGAGISPELLHRVTANATGGLDALPHSGAVITLFTICGLTHRRSNADIAVVAVVVPLAALVVVVTLGSVVGFSDRAASIEPAQCKAESPPNNARLSIHREPRTKSETNP